MLPDPLHSVEFWRVSGIAIAAMGQTAFVVLYLSWPWWSDFLGRALFLKALAFTLLLDIAVAGRIWDWQYEDATFVVLYWLVAIGIWFQFIAFLRVRYRGRQGGVFKVSGNGRSA